MADLATIRTALANRITTGTGLQTLPEGRDLINPPVGVILPGQPVVMYGETMDGALQVSLRVFLLISDAAPNEAVQRALDAYLGIGSGEGQSVAGAIQQDPTLGGTVHYAVPLQAANYGRVDYGGVIYFGARVDVQIGTI